MARSAERESATITDNCAVWLGLPGGIWFGLVCSLHWGWVWALRLSTAAAAGIIGLAAAWRARAAPRETQGSSQQDPGAASTRVSGHSVARRPAVPYLVWIRGTRAKGGDTLVGSFDTHAAAQAHQRRTAARLAAGGSPACVFVRRGR